MSKYTEKYGYPLFSRYTILPALIALTVVLGGGTPVWVQGSVLALVGLALVLNPPRFSLGHIFDWSAVGLLAVSCLALLPAAWMPYGAWRDQAIDQYGINLPCTVVALFQPLGEHFFFTLGALGFLYFILSLEIDTLRRKALILSSIFFSVLLAIVMIAGNSLGLKYPFALDSTIFSYFPNRNQTSTFFCMNAVLAFSSAAVALRCKRYRWLGPFIGAFVLLSIAVFSSVSRAGIVLLFVGAFSFFIFKPFSNKFKLFFRVIVPSFVVVLCVLLSFGSSAFSRLETLLKEKSDYRIEVYQDALHMIGDYWLTGAGGGNFSAVFPQYENKSSIDQRLLHPESDWFWFVSEVGIFGGIVLVIFLYALMLGIFPFSRGENEAVRVIPTAALTVFFLHSFFDVPAHRVGTLYLALFLLGLAVASSKKQKTCWPSWSFRLVGLSLLCVGFLWIASSIGYPFLHSKERVLYDDDTIAEAQRLRDDQLLDKAIASAIYARPLDWWPYFERAKHSLDKKGDINAAELDFQRALFLEPSSEEVAYYEGLVWLPLSSSRAYEAWSRALKRKSRNRKGTYENMRIGILGYKNFYPYFRQLTLQDSDFRYYFLNAIGDRDFSREMDWEMTKGPQLKEFSSEEKIELLTRWVKVGDTETVLDFLDSQPDVLASNSGLNAEFLAKKGSLKEACLLLLDSEPEISVPEVSENRRPDELVRVFQKNKKDLWVGVSLFRYYQELGEINEALSVLKTLVDSGSQPIFVYYWIARIYTQMGEYEKAWPAWEKYLNKGASLKAS